MNKSLRNLHSWFINNHFYKEALFISNLNKYASLNQRQLTIFIQTTFPDLPNTDELSNRLFNLFKGLRDVDSFNQMISSFNQEELEPFVSKLEQLYPQVKSKLDKILPQNIAEAQTKFYIVKFYKEIDTPSFLSNLDGLQSKEDFFNLMKGIKKEKQISPIFEGKNIEGLSQLELQWIEKVYNDPSEAHSVDDILSLVRTFKRDQERFDKKVTDFESYAEVTKYLDSKSGISEHAYMESIRIHAQSNDMSKVVYEDKSWKVVAIGSTIAGQYWRYATNAVPSLCIGRLTNNLFANYAIRGNLDIYFIIDKVNTSTQNPMRMFSLSIERDDDGNPVLSNNASARTNALNQGISIDDIRNKLGNRYEVIYKAILNDAGSRSKSLGRENRNKLIKLTKNRKSVISNIKNIKKYLSELIVNKKDIEKLLSYNISELSRMIAEKWASEGNSYFFEYKLHEIDEYKDLERIIAEKWASEGDRSFFYYKLHEIDEYKDLERLTAEKMASKGNPRFFGYKLNQKYPDLVRIIAEKWTSEGDSDFFEYKLHEIDEYKDLVSIIAEKWASEGHWFFFHYKLHERDEYKDLVRKIAEKWTSEGNQNFFDYNLNQKYPDLERIIAEKWASEGNPRFFNYNLNQKYPDLERIIAEKWGSEGNGSFFHYKLHERDEYKDLARLPAEKMASEGDRSFFIYKLHEIDEYKDLVSIIAEKWASEGNGSFFNYKLHEIDEYKDLVRLIAEKWASEGNSTFFYYKLNQKYPDLERVIAEKWASEGNSLFFDYKLHEKYSDLK